MEINPRTSRGIVLLGLWCAIGCLATLSAPAFAQQTISTAVDGAVVGTNSSITVTTSGTITADINGMPYTVSAGVFATSGSNTTTLTNYGVITGQNAVLADVSGTISTILNFGEISGGADNAIVSGGRIGAITNSGTISSVYSSGVTDVFSIDGVGVISSGTIGTISNSGLIQASALYATAIYNGSVTGTLTNLSSGILMNDGGGSAVVNDGSGLLTLIDNQGLITSNGSYGIYGAGTIGAITNSGTIQGFTGGVLLYSGSHGTITNLAGGSISGTRTDTNYAFGLRVADAATVDAISNSGLIESFSYHSYAISNSGTIGTLTNLSSGILRNNFGDSVVVNDTSGLLTLIDNQGLITTTNSSGAGIVNQDNGTIGTITNSGTISSSNIGIWNSQNGGVTTIGTITNSGLISADYYGLLFSPSTTTGTVSNTGLIGSNLGDGINNSGGFLGNVSNSGTIQGANYGFASGGGDPSAVMTGTLSNAGTIQGDVVGVLLGTGSHGTVTNLAGGSILGIGSSAPGLVVDGGAYVAAISNAGTISSSAFGISVDNGHVASLTNSGLISGIFSTGAGGGIDTFINTGTISGNVSIFGQDVTVSANGGTGSFTNGAFDINGNLTFTNGTTVLAGVTDLNLYSNTLFNQGTLRVVGSTNLYGDFTSTGSSTFLSAVSGTTAGQYGSFSQQGFATFNGVLDLEYINGFQLTAGQQFDLFTFSDYTGSFTGLKVNGMTLTQTGSSGNSTTWAANGLTVREDWGSTSMSAVILTVPVPEPSTLALGAVGIASIAWMRRRSRRR